MLVTETFHGFIETTQDVLLIFEGCRRGLLPRICRRLQEKERKMIQSGSVFVFDERESGIKRWTDGRVWSPSRILGNFLIYRELDKRAPGEKRYSAASTATSAAAAGDMRQRSYSADHGLAGAASSSPDAAGGSGGGGSMDRSRERQLVGSLSDSYKFRADGLIKKTMSIVVNGVAQHLISYYHPNDVLQGNLRSPTSVPELASLEISPELLVKQNFRIPPMVEPAYDRPGNESSSQLSPLTPPDSLTGSYGADRRMHQSLRSMSVGSLRVPDNIAHPHLVYQTPYHRLENSDQKQFAAPGATPQSLPAIYNTGYAIPSPTSLSSSPSTPMLSPVRQSYQQHHQRHYSTSSASYPRNYNSNDLVSLSSQPQQHHPSQSPQQQTQDLHLSHSQQQHTPSLPDIGFFTNHSSTTSVGGETTTINNTIKQESQEARGEGQTTTRYASNANLGQLLNPVHPLHNVSETTTATSPTTTTTAQAQQLYNPMTTSGQGYSYDNAAGTTAGQEDTTANNTSQSSSGGSPIDSHHHHHHHQGGGGSIGIDGYMYYHDRQHSLTNSQHSPDQDAVSLYPKSLLNPFFAHLSLHDSEATDADLTGAGTGLMLK